MTLNTENVADACKRCNSHHQISVENALDYHEQIERLQADLKERNVAVAQMQKTYSENISRYEAEAAKNQEEYAKLRYRHEALLEAFKNLQKVNHTLEDKLISVVSDMTRRYEQAEQRCKSLTASLETARGRIAQLTAAEDDQDEEPYSETPNRPVPTSLAFGGTMLPMYHSSPDLVGMVKAKQRNTCPPKPVKQIHSPFAISTFPPTLVASNMSPSMNSSAFAPRREELDGYDEASRTMMEGERSRSNTGNYPGLSSDLLTSPPPISATIVNELAGDSSSSSDLKTHRTHTGSVFTV